MDQLRKAWGWLQRQHFWVLTVVAILVALGCWWRGANALLAEYQSNRGKIESEFTAAGAVRSKPYHANADIQKAQSDQIANQQKSVHELWKQLYARQTAGVLKWPSNLSQEFRNYVEKLKFGDNIPPNLRSHYNNYIRDHFPELPKIVGALEAPEGQQGYNANSFDPRAMIGRGFQEGSGAQAMEEPDYLVIWADQQLVRDELNPGLTPTPKRIWKTQEDLWVYEALLQIIANTNKAAHADRFSNSAVRVIQSLEVGRTAAQASRGTGRIEMVATAPTAGGETGAMAEGAIADPRAMESAGAAMGGEMVDRVYGEGGRGGTGMDLAANDAELFNNRYVGADGAPIADPGDGNPAAFGTEFKRLPVRMTLRMDQRWLPQLISECANAPLQVEVQEVRINPADGGTATGGGGYGERGGGYGLSGGQQEGVEMTPEAEPNMKMVVLQGVVYIFNPPTETPADASGQVAGVQ